MTYYQFISMWRPPLRRKSVGRVTGLLAAGLSLLWLPAARADLIFSVNDVTAAAGSSGNTTLEVSLTNDGSVATPAIAAFQFQLTVPAASGVTFVAADILTANHPYLFGADTSTPPLSFDAFPNTAFTASDLYSITNGGVVLGAQQTFGLGRVTFDVAPSASGVVPVTFVPGLTEVLDPNGRPIDLNYRFVDGSIRVSAVPEPSSLVLVLLGGAPLLFGYLYYINYPNCSAVGRSDRARRGAQRTQ